MGPRQQGPHPKQWCDRNRQVQGHRRDSLHRDRLRIERERAQSQDIPFVPRVQPDRRSRRAGHCPPQRNGHRTVVPAQAGCFCVPCRGAASVQQGVKHNRRHHEQTGQPTSRWRVFAPLPGRRRRSRRLVADRSLLQTVSSNGNWSRPSNSSGGCSTSRSFRPPWTRRTRCATSR